MLFTIKTIQNYENFNLMKTNFYLLNKSFKNKDLLWSDCYGNAL